MITLKFYQTPRYSVTISQNPSISALTMGGIDSPQADTAIIC